MLNTDCWRPTRAAEPAPSSVQGAAAPQRSRAPRSCLQSGPRAHTQPQPCPAACVQRATRNPPDICCAELILM